MRHKKLIAAIILLFFLVIHLSINITYSSKSILERASDVFYSNEKLTRSYESKLVSQKYNIKNWIVVTSINQPTFQIDKLSKLKDFQLLVVGDKKTNADWNYKNVIYLSVEMQQELGYKSYETTPFNSYTRKNIGYLYAIQNGAQCIYDTDDDNAPIHEFLSEYFDIDKKHNYGMTIDNANDTNVVNPYAHFGQPTIWPRGYPLNKIHLNYDNYYICGKLNVSIVQQGLVNGDPDVDAIFRLTKTMNYKKLNITFDGTAPSLQIPKNIFTPYNSQNTLFHYNAFWSMYLPNTVTFRLTDIWRSYWAQRLMWLIGGTVTFHGPSAFQVRNSHSYLKDFEEEQAMYVKTDNLVNYLSDWKCKTTKFFDCVIDLSEGMAENDFWSVEEAESIKNWIIDLKRLGYVEPKIVTYEPIMDVSDKLLAKYFRVRYTPVYQSNVDIDNYCCENVRPLEVISKVDTLKYLSNFCNDSSMTFLNNLSHLNYVKYSTDNKKALLVTFNHEPKIEAIEYIKYIYGDYFKPLVFCGHNILSKLTELMGKQKQFDSYTFIELNTHYGYYHYYCMNKMIEMNFHVDGILLMSDDVMLKYWNLNDLDDRKVWFFRPLECTDNTTMDYPKYQWKYWINKKIGLPALHKLWDHFQSIKNGTIEISDEEYDIISNYLSTYRKNYVTKRGLDYEAVQCRGGSDIFYLPKSKFKDFLLISNMFRKYNVFLELAIPMILAGITDKTNACVIHGKYIWHINLNWNDENVFTRYEKIKHFYHKVKVTLMHADKRRVTFCNLFIKDKIDFDTQHYS